MSTPIAFDRIVRGATCVTPGGLAEVDIGIRGGLIAAIGALGDAAAIDVLDARGLHVLPGVIDAQVHFREPGPTHKEDLATGTAAAAKGGVTCVLEMPNTDPPTTTAGALADKVARLAHRAQVDVGFFVGGSPDNLDDLDELERLPGCAGIKIFMGSSTGTLLIPDDAALARALSSGVRRVAIHAEDEDRLRERKPLATSVDQHPVWRDAETALRATWRVLALARRFGRRVHILHVTTGDELGVIADCRDLATCETSPQHLTFAAPEIYERLGSLAQMNPPIRSAEHRAALWRAIDEGVIDLIATDHAPHTLAEKAQAYPASPSGMPGVQTMLPVMLDHVAAGRLSLTRLVELVSTGPARVWGLAGKGRLAVGYDADLTLVDLAARRTVRNADMASKCGWSPFEGLSLTGWPVATIVRGHVVMRDGQLVGAPCGRAARFIETIAPTAAA